MGLTGVPLMITQQSITQQQVQQVVDISVIQTILGVDRQVLVKQIKERQLVYLFLKMLYGIQGLDTYKLGMVIAGNQQDLLIIIMKAQVQMIVDLLVLHDFIGMVIVVK